MPNWVAVVAVLAAAATLSACVDPQPRRPEATFLVLEISGLVEGDGTPPAKPRICSSGPFLPEAVIDPKNRSILIRNMEHAGGIGTAPLVVWQHVVVRDEGLASCLGWPSVDAREESSANVSWGLQGLRAWWTIQADGETIRVNETSLARGAQITQAITFFAANSSVVGPSNFTGTITLTNLGEWSWRNVQESPPNEVVTRRANWARWMTLKSLQD